MRWLRRIAVAVIGVVGLLIGSASAVGEVSERDKKPEKRVDLKVGDAAPMFEGTDESGNLWKLKDRAVKKFVVVYFYPADFTPGCTKQAEAWRENMNAIRDAGVEVVGVSGDSVKNHKLFKETWKLNFRLLADEKAEVAKQFGVPVKKRVGRVRPRGPDRKFLKNDKGAPLQLTRQATFSRWTFVIGEQGKVVYKNTKVRPAQDSKQVLEFIEKSRQTTSTSILPGDDRSEPDPET